MKKKIILFFIFLFIFTVIFLPKRGPDNRLINPGTTLDSGRFWKYQCIDTMKTSRDKARAWANDPYLQTNINWEMQMISGMGANCVAIDTPYDAEFLPVLKKWVTGARERNLKIWFRGNFSSWEGWFDYPKGMTTDEHNQKTFDFITQNPDLFRNGDIFTPSPEAENGGPFNQVETDEHAEFRQYLISQHDNAANAFKIIGKKVELNWLSMNGGFAKRMMDQETVDKLGRTVALDHYIKTAPEMGEYINYFYDKFGSKSIIGEVGAPVPEINGQMSESKQADFIDQLLYELYKNKDKVEGLNYWTLYDGSTALYRPDLSPKPAVETIRNYFIPALVEGVVVNDLGNKVDNAVVKTEDEASKTTTDKNGYFNLSIPAKKTNLVITHSSFSPETVTVIPNKERKIVLNITLFQDNPDIVYQIIKFYKKYLAVF